LDLPGVVIADQNASSGYVRFAPSPHGLVNIDRDLTYAEWWTHPDPIEQFRRRSAKCAEVLVPDRVAPDFLEAAYVASEATRLAFELNDLELPVIIRRQLFFE
jgi:hypothetical protein